MIACMRLFRNKNKQNTTFILKCTSHLDFVSVNTNYFFKVSITEIFKRIGLTHVSFQTNPSFCNTMTPHKIQDNVKHSDVTYTLSLKRVYKSPALAWSMSGWTLFPQQPWVEYSRSSPFLVSWHQLVRTYVTKQLVAIFCCF